MGGEVNRPISEENFESIYTRIKDYFVGKDVFVQDVTVAAHPEHNKPIRIITDKAWHSLFARNMFLEVSSEKLKSHIPEYTVIMAPEFSADPKTEGTNTETVIAVNFEKKLILIGGTVYSGEIKKSIFTALNLTLPKLGVLPMHCSATVGQNNDVSLFFGLSGTGKTTLSSDLDRRLVGDDEHGWGDTGVFNFEGGCYAKAIRLKPELEPLIFNATRRFGTILENVGYDEETREVDYDDATLTENTRASYPIEFLPNIVEDGCAGHPNHVFFLTADAFGVLPPISKLTPEQAQYYFLSGYTAKVAGTEKGLGKEPQATFSACFGAPFLPLHPKVYTDLLKEKVQTHNAQVWLINTGWSGGPYGVGKRIHLPYTRAMVNAALNGKLDKVDLTQDGAFGLSIPTSVPEVPDELLNPKDTWTDKSAYDTSAKELISRFHKNFEQYKDEVSQEIINAGPAFI